MANFTRLSEETWADTFLVQVKAVSKEAEVGKRLVEIKKGMALGDHFLQLLPHRQGKLCLLPKGTW